MTQGKEIKDMAESELGIIKKDANFQYYIDAIGNTRGLDIFVAVYNHKKLVRACESALEQLTHHAEHYGYEAFDAEIQELKKALAEVKDCVNKKNHLLS